MQPLSAYITGSYAISLAFAVFASRQTFLVAKMVKSPQLHTMWLSITYASVATEIIHAITIIYIATIPDNSSFATSSTIILAASVIFAGMATLMRQSAADLLQIPLLQELVLQDPLTGIGNRRAFDQAIDAGVVGEKMGLVLLDIDHFKLFNDTYGHEVGDLILKDVARAISDSSFGHTVYRIGGEEFAILTNSTLQSTIAVAENCRRSVESIRLTDAGSAPSTTVSAGVSASDKPDTARSLMCRADSALYDAKNSGRNKVVAWQGFREFRPDENINRQDGVVQPPPLRIESR